MTSSNGNIFRVTGHLYGEFTGLLWIPEQRPVTRSFEVFFDLRMNKQLSKQSWGWWFETISCPLWRQCNVPDIAECISLKPQDGFSLFEVLWNYLKLQLCNVMVICLFATHGLAYAPKTDQIRHHSARSRLCVTHISINAWWIYTPRSFMELSKVLIAQQHELVTLTLYFKGQMLKKPYHRNRTADWHGMKGMWINRKWDTLCDFVTINGLYILRSIDRGVLPLSEYLVVWAAILITLHAVRPGGYFW